MSRRGENIYKRKDGRWEARVPNGYSPDGKRKYRSLYAASYKEVKQLKIDYLTLSNNNYNLKSLKFNDIARQWLNKIQISVKESTYYCYENLLHIHILPELGGISLKYISTSTIDEFTWKKLNSGRIDGKGGLSNKTVRDILYIIKSILLYAKIEYQFSYQSISIQQPKLLRKEVKILDLEEQKMLENHLESEQTLYSIGIFICLYCGLRLGEICALQWKSIFLKEKYIFIQSTISRVKNVDDHSSKTKLIFTSPKTQQSIRKIPLPDFLIKFMLRYQEEHVIKDDTYFLTGSSTHYLSPRTYQHYFKRVLEKCYISNYNFHVLRHTFASRAIESGMDAKTLSELLGHASVSTTLNRYVHSSEFQKQKQMKQMVNYLRMN